MNNLDEMSAAYEATANELKARILALIPTHPEILDFKDAWGLFRVSDFRCDDLGPSMAQAGWAWCRACKEYRESAGLKASPSS